MLKRVAILIATMLACAEAQADAFVYSPWAKICLTDLAGKQICSVGTGAWLACGPIVFGASLTEQEKKTTSLNIHVPGSTIEQPGARISIDEDVIVTARYELTMNNRRSARYEADASLIDKMKRGRTLTIEVVDPDRGSVALPISLDGFAKAYDGPGLEAPKVTEHIVSKEKIQEMLKESEERNKRLLRPGWPRCD